MAKKLILGSLAVFIAWYVLDIAVHGFLLGSAYQATAELWRPEAEMKSILMMFVVLVSAAVFVYIYTAFVGNKNKNTALKYGIIFGIGAGMSMGYGTYAVQPITYSIALSWFLLTVLQGALGGTILGIIVKD